VAEITDSIEDDLEEIVTDDDDERLQDVRPEGESVPDDEVSVADRVSSILSGEGDVDPERIEKGTAEEIAEILDGDDDEDDEDDGN